MEFTPTQSPQKTQYGCLPDLITSFFFLVTINLVPIVTFIPLFSRGPFHSKNFCSTASFDSPVSTRSSAYNRFIYLARKICCIGGSAFAIVASPTVGTLPSGKHSLPSPEVQRKLHHILERTYPCNKSMSPSTSGV